jgi:hypothetical protein
MARIVISQPVCEKFFRANGMIDCVKTITKLSKNVHRNYVIIQLVIDIAKHTDVNKFAAIRPVTNILVCSDRLEQLRDLKSAVDGVIRKNDMCISTHMHTMVCSADFNQDVGTNNIYFCSYSSLELHIPSFNVMVHATPRKRKMLADLQTNIVTYCIDDGLPCFLQKI